MVCLDNVILSLSCLLILFSFPAPRLHSHPLFPSILLSSSQNSFLQFALPRSENCPGDLPSSSLRHPPIQFTCACAPHPQHCLRDNPRAHTSSRKSFSSDCFVDRMPASDTSSSSPYLRNRVCHIANRREKLVRDAKNYSLASKSHSFTKNSSSTIPHTHNYRFIHLQNEGMR